MDDFAPMDLDGNCIPPLAPTTTSINAANASQVNAKAKPKAVSTERSARDTAAFDAWKASVTGGDLDDNSTIYEIAVSIKLQHPTRWQIAEGPQFKLIIPDYDGDELKFPKLLNQVELHAIRWWISKLTFSDVRTNTWHGNNQIEKTSDYSKLKHYQCTFVELAIALEAETNVCLGGAYTDLLQKSKLIQIALRFLTQHCKLYFQQIGTVDAVGKRSTYKQLFDTSIQNTTREVTGTWLDGMGRRPTWLHSTHTEDVVSANLYLARMHQKATTHGPIARQRQYASRTGQEFWQGLLR